MPWELFDISHPTGDIQRICSLYFFGIPSAPVIELFTSRSFFFLFGRLTGGTALVLSGNNANANETDTYGGNISTSTFEDRLTAAERRFVQQRETIELERLAKMVSKSHRDRIQEFNQYLANLSEHYDIPKVGPG